MLFRSLLRNCKYPVKSESVSTIWIVVIAGLVLIGAAMPAWADTIVLKNGMIVEGTIARESAKYVVVKTKHGRKSFRRSDIDRIVKESDEGSAVEAIRTIKNFDDLSEIARELKNAEALYDLGRFDDIPARVEPWLGKGTKFDDMRIRWMLIETYERQAKWNKVERLLKQTLEDGREPDKIRAKAHLDIFKQNPGHTLRKIEVVKGKRKRATEFLSREMRNLGKKPNALQDRKMMEAALVEYVDQILQQEDVSVESFKENLDVDETFAIIQKAIDAGSRNVVRTLPYTDDLRKVEHDQLALAMRTCSEQLQAKVFKNMSGKAAAMIRESMELMGAVRAEEVEAARQRLVDIVKDLERRGEAIKIGRAHV